MNEQAHRTLAIEALRAYRGDNLPRAEAAFRGLSPEGMAIPYGRSGKTRQEILDAYRHHDAAISAAIRWLTQEEPPWQDSPGVCPPRIYDHHVEVEFSDGSRSSDCIPQDWDWSEIPRDDGLPTLVRYRDLTAWREAQMAAMETSL